jgi:hypothetical protein
LPNLPSEPGDRSKLEDHVVLCHAWNSRVCKDPPEGSELEYPAIAPLKRRCTLAEPFASAVIAKIMSVISSSGTPDLPQSERNRLDGRTKEIKAAASASTGVKAKVDPAVHGKLEGQKQQ